MNQFLAGLGCQNEGTCAVPLVHFLAFEAERDGFIREPRSMGTRDVPFIFLLMTQLSVVVACIVK